MHDGQFVHAFVQVKPVHVDGTCFLDMHTNSLPCMCRGHTAGDLNATCHSWFRSTEHYTNTITLHQHWLVLHGSIADSYCVRASIVYAVADDGSFACLLAGAKGRSLTTNLDFKFFFFQFITGTLPSRLRGKYE